MTSKICSACGHRNEHPGATDCSNCGVALSDGVPAAVVPRSAPDGPSSVPFDDTSQPFLRRLLQTIRMAFTNPQALFSNLPADDILQPVLYHVIIGTVAFAFSMVGWFLIGGLGFLTYPGSDFGGLALGGIGMLICLLFAPVLVAIGLFLWAGVCHLMLLLLGDGSRGFAVTLRAVAYGSTPNLIVIVPFCGGLIASVWSLVLMIIGASCGHRTDAWRAILAFVIPIFACICLWAGVIATALMIGIE